MIWEKKRSFGFRQGMAPSDDNFDRGVVNSILLLSGLLGGYTDVILDGANIIHGGSNGSGMDGRRLVSAINYYEDKGYTVHAVLKQETFNYMRKQKTNGFEDIDKLIEEGRIQLYRKNDDHLAIVLSIEHNGWLITHDTFKTHKNTTPRERETHPEWFEKGMLDARTRGTLIQHDGWISSGYDWHVEDEKFFDPDIADINFLKERNNSNDYSLIKDARLIGENLMKLKSKSSKLNDISSEQKGLISQCQENINQFIHSLRDSHNSLDVESIIKDLTVYELKQICHNRSINIEYPLKEILQEETRVIGYFTVKSESKLVLKEINNHLDIHHIPHKRFRDKEYMTQVYFATLGDRKNLENMIIEDISKRGLFLFHKEGMTIFFHNQYTEFQTLHRADFDKLYSDNLIAPQFREN